MNRDRKKKKNSISIGHIQPAQNSHKTLKKTLQQQIQAFQIEIRVKQDSRNIKPKTRNHLSLTNAQKCNYFVY